MSSHSDSYGQRQAIAASAAIRKISMGIEMGCRSMPNSPRLMPKQSHFYRPPASPAHSSNGDAASTKSNGHSKDTKIAQSNGSNPSWHFSALTDHLNVQQVNNYKNQTSFPEINWQERCLELQLDFYRLKNQSDRIRSKLQDKVSENVQSKWIFYLSLRLFASLIGISHFRVEYIWIQITWCYSFYVCLLQTFCSPQ